MSDIFTAPLRGRIDSSNAAETEEELLAQLKESGCSEVILDAAELEYISSAGLRILLRIKKNYPDMQIINASPEVYEILEMTGFTEILTVKKAYRTVSLEGCEQIGRGANGIIYRVDKDNVVKVYSNPGALDEIQHEREVARLALVLGIPTAISYDVVRVNNSYGSVFEFLNARSFSSIIANEPDRVGWCVNEYVKMLKTIHGTLVPEGKLPEMKQTAIGWAEFMQDHLEKKYAEKLLALVKAVPDDSHMIHGDYHTQNLVLQNDEVLLIDMDTLAVGHPIFEFASVFNAFMGFSEYDHTAVERFQGFSYETSKRFWHEILAAYLGTECETKIQEVADKARVIGYTRLIRRAIRRHENESEKGRAETALRTRNLTALLERIDTLEFSADELEIEADRDRLQEVLGFIEERLEAVQCPYKAMMQIALAAEEIFVNIATYAYHPDKGKACVRVVIGKDPVNVAITFTDHGIPYDPLAKDDPDITLPAQQREIGGLGVFLAKKTMDDIIYEYKDGRNILTLKKNLQK